MARMATISLLAIQVNTASPISSHSTDSLSNHNMDSPINSNIASPSNPINPNNNSSQAICSCSKMNSNLKRKRTFLVVGLAVEL